MALRYRETRVSSTDRDVAENGGGFRRMLPTKIFENHDAFPVPTVRRKIPFKNRDNIGEKKKKNFKIRFFRYASKNP